MSTTIQFPFQIPEVVTSYHRGYTQMVTNSDDVRQLTSNWKDFRNTTGSLRGYMVQFRHPHDNDIEFIYVVKSYEAPIYVAQVISGQWYGTPDNFSRTTSRHQKLAEPVGKPITWVNHALLRRFADVGFRYMSAVRVIRGEKV